jgi:cobyrinic acid a,c-diamide synthase
VSGGIIFAAPKSGSGKTLIVAGLLRHLRRRGARVASAKVGPDYIDPTFHSLAAGTPCVNLDPWAMRPTTLAAFIAEVERRAKIVLCEGVMGLFDGAGPDGEAGSTAELARLTGWPVVLVVDVSGQAGSVAALAAGFARHDGQVPLAGLILNRVASPRHHALLSEAIARHVPDVPVLGAVSADESMVLTARHLGLVPAGEIRSIDALLDRAAARVGESCDIDRLLVLARPSRRKANLGAPGLPPLGQHIAVARDDAFLFTYEATLAGCRRRGAEISFFSPLADTGPAADADAVYLPGGYPELHAAKLAAATRFLASLSAGDRTIYGECGGYMVLGEALTDADGQTHRMAGLLPLSTSFAERRRHLGYRSARLLASGPLGAEGTRFRGHEFHYATILEEKGRALFSAADASGNELGRAGLRCGKVFGSFIHLMDSAD